MLESLGEAPMVETLTLTLNLSPETRAFIRRKIEQGEFASESELVAESVAAMREVAEELERWEQENVIAAHDEYRNNPRTAVSSSQLQSDLAQARLERLKAS
jgi:antitoxin ParD1/3/4